MLKVVTFFAVGRLRHQQILPDNIRPGVNVTWFASLPALFERHILNVENKVKSKKLIMRNILIMRVKQQL